jgi:hypothetical protein
MQHNEGPDEDQELVNLGNPASEPESASDSIVVRQRLEIAAQPSCSYKLLVVPGAHKAMAASVPGTEYWLP